MDQWFQTYLLHNKFNSSPQRKIEVSEKEVFWLNIYMLLSFLMKSKVCFCYSSLLMPLIKVIIVFIIVFSFLIH